MTDNNTQKPTIKLAQEKAYYVVDANGNRTRKTKTVDIAVGYENTSKNGNAYTKYTLHLGDITADVDGVVKLVGFGIDSK
ncbi:MAG: hypothetical protein AAF731_12255 [Bacteroidota bacterium]